MASNPFARVGQGMGLGVPANPFANILQMGIDETMVPRVPSTSGRASGPGPQIEAPQPGDMGTGMSAQRTGDTTPGADFEHYRNAIKKLESGGDYGNVTPTGKGDDALGAYQVRSSELPEWSREVFGREVSRDEFLKSKPLQDKMFEAKFGQALSKYGTPDDAASVWFSGRPIAKAGNAHDLVVNADGSTRPGNTVSQYVGKFRQAVAESKARGVGVIPGAPAQAGSGDVGAAFKQANPRAPGLGHYPSQTRQGNYETALGAAPASTQVEDRRGLPGDKAGPVYDTMEDAYKNFTPQQQNAAWDSFNTAMSRGSAGDQTMADALGKRDIATTNMPRDTFAQRVQLDPAEGIHTIAANNPKEWQQIVQDYYSTNPLARGQDPATLLPRDTQDLFRRLLAGMTKFGGKP